MGLFETETNSQTFLGSFVLCDISWDEFRPFFLEHRPYVFPDDHSAQVDSLLSEEEYDATMRLGMRMNGLFRLAQIIRTEEDVVGWSWGLQRDREEYYMVNSAIFEPFQGQGIYKALLPLLMQRLKQEGFQYVTSRHNPENEAIIKAKMDYGFRPTGVDVTDRYGPLLLLGYYFNEKRQAFLDAQIENTDMYSVVNEYF